MSMVTIVGMVMGALLILAVVAATLMKRESSKNVIALAFVGLVLIGMSQWNSISVGIDGVKLEGQLNAMRDSMSQTASVVADVAAEAQHSAVAVETTREQVETLTQQLEDKKLVTPVFSAEIREALNAAPRADTARLRIAGSRLRVLSRPTLRVVGRE